MTVIWLIVWLIQGTPAPEMWNNWGIALAICLVLDVLGTGTASRR